MLRFIRTDSPDAKMPKNGGAVRLRILTIQAIRRGVAPEGFQRAIGKPFGGADVAEPKAQKAS